MKTIIIALATLCVASPALAQTFEFRGETTATVVDLTSKEGCERIEGVDYCTAATELGGVNNVIYSASYFDGRLNGLLGQFDGDRFMTMLAAFRTKYGEPVMSEAEWRNRAGAVLPNTVATWTFEDGVLTLKQIGSRVTDGSFQFVTLRNQPPAPAPKVDF